MYSSETDMTGFPPPGLLINPIAVLCRVLIPQSGIVTRHVTSCHITESGLTNLLSQI